MKTLFRKIFRLKPVWLLLVLAFSLLVSAPARADAGPGRCTGKFVNPITDICWSCLFPLSIGALDMILKTPLCPYAFAVCAPALPWGSGSRCGLPMSA